MAKYLDETGLSTLWKKIKGTFVAQIIKKSDSSNATQITHNGDTVSLSRGTISGTGSASTYTASAGIDIGVDDMITFTSTSRPQWRIDKNHDNVGVAILSDLDGKSNTGHTHSYNDLTNKPTIGNAQITIRQNGTEKGSFTLNQTSPKAIDLIDTTYDIATQSAPGLMSKDDKNKLDRIETGANKTIVDTALSSTSTNPVQNKVINTALSTANTNISTNATNIGHLQGYFDNGKAIYAINDANAQPITTTYATKTELNAKANASDFNLFKNSKGQHDGLASLDSSGKVPSSQLPSYVDDVIEGYYYNSKFYKEESHKNEITGESGKIYTDLGNNKTYRWSGTTYTEISASLALGTTSSTAYPGNLGAANASNITTLKSYFTGDVANKAAADGDGNNIVDTYATKSALSNTLATVSTNAVKITTLQSYFTDGVAKQAAADGDGNNIVDTYATKQNLSSVAQNASAKIDKSVLTAKGDIIYASAASTPAKLAIGSNGKVLKVVNGIPAWSDDNNTHNSHIVYSGKKTDGLTDISSGTASSGNITLGDSGVTAGSYGDTSNQTPRYGDTFKVSSLTVNAKGIVTRIATHTVKIPDNNATTSAAGLMSVADKTKLDSIQAISTDYINGLS